MQTLKIAISWYTGRKMSNIGRHCFLKCLPGISLLNANEKEWHRVTESPKYNCRIPPKPSWTSIKCTLLCNYGSLGMSSFCSRLTPSNRSLTLKEPNSQNEDANLTKVKWSRVRWANQDLCWREVSLTKWQNWVASTVADIKTSRLRWTDSPPNYLQHCKLPPTEVKARLGMWQVGVLLQTPLQ